VPIIVLGLLALAGCTADSGRPASSTPPTAPRSPSRSPSAAGPPAGQPVQLSCAESGRAARPTGAGDLTVGGLVLEGLAGSGRATNRAADAGLRVPPGLAQSFRKAPAYLPAGTRSVTVEVLTSSKALVAWVPARIWLTGGSVKDLRPWARSKVTFAGCPDRTSTYFGGLLAASARTCIPLRIRPAGGRPQTRRVRLDGSAC
jgi:hypothetical protein